MTKRQIEEQINWDEFLNNVITELRSLERTYADRIMIADRTIARLQREHDNDTYDFRLLWALRIRRIQMYRDALKNCFDEQVYDCPL